MIADFFPLHWPAGFTRTRRANRTDSKFKLTPDKARKDLLKQVELLCGDDKPILSCNVPLRKDGGIYSDVAQDDIDDPGVAIYFMYQGRQRVVACDAWLTPAENIRALGLTIEAFRGLDRWGGSQILDRVFTGFKALPEQSSNDNDNWKILGLSAQPANEQEVTAAYKAMVKKTHPDAPGGSTEAFQALNKAYHQVLSFFK